MQSELRDDNLLLGGNHSGAECASEVVPTVEEVDTCGGFVKTADAESGGDGLQWQRFER